MRQNNRVNTTKVASRLPSDASMTMHSIRCTWLILYRFVECSFEQ